MGCDIHGWIERKHNGKWVAYSDLKDRTRNYERFAALAGVRGLGPEAKGLPEDASETVRAFRENNPEADEECWYADGHSDSWLPLKDAFEIFKKFRFEKLNEYYSEYTAFGVDFYDEEDWENYRLVFWFDN